MPSRRRFLRRIGATATTVSLAAMSGCLGAGSVRTKVGGGWSNTIDLSSPDDDVFVPPNQFTTYVNRMREAYDEVAIPGLETKSLAGDFVGAYTRQEVIVPDRRFAVQDAAILVHRLDETCYRLRLWSAGRLLKKNYEVDPWGHYKKELAFTRLEQGISVKHNDNLSTNRSISTSGGHVDVAGEVVTIPDGYYNAGLADNVRYRSRWEGFHAGTVTLLGACKVSFTSAEEQQLEWEISNGVGIRTPF